MNSSSATAFTVFARFWQDRKRLSPPNSKEDGAELGPWAGSGTGDRGRRSKVQDNRMGWGWGCGWLAGAGLQGPEIVYIEAKFERPAATSADPEKRSCSTANLALRQKKLKLFTGFGYQLLLKCGLKKHALYTSSS